MDIKTVIQATHIQPHWAVSHTVNFIGEYYMKLSILEAMNSLYRNGAVDSDFTIAVRSIDLYSRIPNEDNEYSIEHDNNDFIFLEGKAENAQSFWKKFHSLQRPIIMCRNRYGEYEPIYYESQALSFTKIELNSPHKYHMAGKKVLTVLAEGIIVYGLNVGLDNILNRDEQLVNVAREIREINVGQQGHTQQHIDLLNGQEEIRNNQRLLREMIRENEERNEVMLREIKEIRNEPEMRELPFIQNEQNHLMRKLNNKLHKMPFIVNDLNIG